MGHGNQRPDIELVRAFMPVLVTSNFDDDSIKNEWASMATPFSHYKSMGNFRCSRAANPIVSSPIWPKFELVRDFMHVLVTCKYKKDRVKSNRGKVVTEILCMSSLPASIKRIGSKVTEKRWRHHFPHHKSRGISVAMDTRVLIQSA